MISKFLDLLDIVPGFVWLGICIFLGMSVVGSRVQLANARAQISEEVSKFATYRSEVSAKQALAVQKQREVELENFRNSEKVAYEQQKRDKTYAEQLARSRSNEQRMRDELSSFRAAAAGDAQRGDVARLAARADLATGLYASCRDEYRGMAAEAERIRRQALGLWEYIKGNSQCSRPFGANVTEPVD